VRQEFQLRWLGFAAFVFLLPAALSHAKQQKDPPQ
jgi:hypothetical protein